MILPTLKLLRRYVLAARDTSSRPRSRYSQNGEDAWLSGHISAEQITAGIYIDVGANHPTVISNTYLFYRRGGHGFIVEPNRGFRGLYRRFRKRDIILTVGCGKTTSVAKFFANRSTVLSSFLEDKSISDGRFEYVPIITLDSLQEATGGRPVYLLSIDVEGLNYDVLSGAGVLLEATAWLVIEFGDERAEIMRLMTTRGFVLAHETAHNLLFRNTKV